jgi:23S rRNA (uracil1939-C5)-methyltransferase
LQFPAYRWDSVPPTRSFAMKKQSHDTPTVGQEADLTIDSTAFGGEGVARLGKYVLFVPDVIPGETVRVKITETKRSYGRGAPVRIVEASPDRVEPPCEVYGLCGGCQYQHVRYNRAVEFKEQQLKEVILRIGGLAIDDLCRPIRPAPGAYGYRNAIALHARSREQEWEVGYFARDNRTLVPISHCPIATRPINQFLTDIVGILTGFECVDRIKNVTVKSDGERTFFHPTYERPLRFRSGERLCYRHQDLVLRYGLGSFFQVNHSMIPTLLELVGESLEGVVGGGLFDLYAGVGLFSIALAGRFHKVVGIESAWEAVDCFRDNIRENGCQNVVAIRGSVEGNLKDAFEKIKGEINSVIVDPPREGMTRQVIQFLNEAAIRTLIYVSCNPGTLGRDLKLLGDSYSLRKITPLDMFPQTRHLEVVAVLERTDHAV